MPTRRRFLLSLAAAAVVGLAPAAAAPPRLPPLVFQTQPAGKLLDDLRAAARMLGGDKAVAEFNDKLKGKFGDKGLDGLDLTRPTVGASDVTSDGDEFGVYVLPITGEAAFLALVERVGGKAEAVDGKKGLYALSYPDADDEESKMWPKWLRFADGLAYLADREETVATADVLLPPDRLLAPNETALVAVHVHFDRFPDDVRAAAAKALDEKVKELDAAPLPPAASDVLQKVTAQFQAMGKRFMTQAKEADRFALRLRFDPAGGDFAAEGVLTAKPGTSLAKDLVARGANVSPFAGLVTRTDAAAGLVLQLPLFTGELRESAALGIEAGREPLAGLTPEGYRPAVEELMTGLARTVRKGGFELAAAVYGPDPKGLFDGVLAVAFDDPSGVERELRKAFAGTGDDGPVKFDVAKVGGVGIHKVRLPDAVTPPENAKAYGGDPSFAVAFAKHAVLVGQGPDPVATVRAALEAKPGVSPAFDVAVNPARLAKLIAATGEKDVAKRVADALGGEDKAASLLSIGLSGGDALTLRVAMNFKLLGKVGTLKDVEAKGDDE